MGFQENDKNNMRPFVFVTGAGSGIGAATAERFAKEGWNVILIGRREEALKTVAQKIQSTHPSCSVVVFQLDVSSRDSENIVGTWAKKNPDVASKITSLIHNAGIVDRETTLESSDESWHRTFETNLFGVVRLTKALSPYLKSNKGSITTVNSTLGLRPLVEMAAYSASKAALLNWAAAFAKEVGPEGVRVNSVCPGIIDTPIHPFHTAKDKAAIVQDLNTMQPLGRIGQPEDVAHMIWSLTGPGSEWTTGAVVCVDGGINL